MHPTQHSTIHRRGSAPVVSHTIGIECTHEDILAAIRQISSRQSTCFVMIATVASALGLNDHDRSWLNAAITELEQQGLVCLNAVERPQQVTACLEPWNVRNASGIPCHEICIAPESHRIAPLLRDHAPALPLYPRAAATCTANPHMREQRITQLVRGAAEALQHMGRKCAKGPLSSLFTTGRAA